MKKIFFLLIALLMFSNSAKSGPIEVTYNDGIYHIVLSGDKIKKRISTFYSAFISTAPVIYTHYDINHSFQII